MTKTNFMTLPATILTPEFCQAINNPTYATDPQNDGEIPYPDPDGIGLTAEILRAQAAEQALGESVDLKEPLILIESLPATGVETFRWLLNGSASYLDSENSAFSDDYTFGASISMVAGLPVRPRLAHVSIAMAIAYASIPDTSAECALEITTPASLAAQLRNHLLLIGPLFFPCMVFQPGANKSRLLFAQIWSYSLLPSPQPISVRFLDPSRSSTTYTYHHLHDDFGGVSPGALLIQIHGQIFVPSIPAP
jgi:hypothetical protein